MINDTRVVSKSSPAVLSLLLSHKKLGCFFFRAEENQKFGEMKAPSSYSSRLLFLWKTGKQNWEAGVQWKFVKETLGMRDKLFSLFLSKGLREVFLNFRVLFCATFMVKCGHKNNGLEFCIAVLCR